MGGKKTKRDDDDDDDGGEEKLAKKRAKKMRKMKAQEEDDDDENNNGYNFVEVPDADDDDEYEGGFEDDGNTTTNRKEEEDKEGEEEKQKEEKKKPPKPGEFPLSNTKVYMGNLSWHIDDESLKRAFVDIGEIKSIVWMEEKLTKKFLGAGVVEFSLRRRGDESSRKLWKNGFERESVRYEVGSKREHRGGEESSGGERRVVAE